jgi:hypothetical protein
MFEQDSLGAGTFGAATALIANAGRTIAAIPSIFSDFMIAPLNSRDGAGSTSASSLVGPLRSVRRRTKSHTPPQAARPIALLGRHPSAVSWHPFAFWESAPGEIRLQCGVFVAADRSRRQALIESIQCVSTGRLSVLLSCRAILRPPAI